MVLKLRYICVCVVISGILSSIVFADEVTIIDTRNATSDLGWPSSGGWTELTDTDETDVDLRTFQVCRIKRPHQNNWLRTPYLEVGNVKQIFVEIRFTIRSCVGLRRIISCKETFNLYYLPSDAEDDVKASRMNAETYTKVDTIAADERFKPDNMNANTETRSITSITTRGLYLAFQDTGACLNIMYVRVFYKTCPQIQRGLALFPVTNTGPETTSLVDTPGSCVANASPPKNGPGASLHCSSGGKWMIPSGSCQCMAGYEPDAKMTKCIKCGLGTFKSLYGNTPCFHCPPNSFSVKYGSTSCQCTSGFFRAAEDPVEGPCSKPPGPPVDAEAFVNKTTVTLTWSPPRDSTGRTDLSYSVSCEKCLPTMPYCIKCEQSVNFNPRKSRLTSGTVFISDLSPHTNYRFKIYSFNGVSGLSNLKAKFAQIKIKTNKDAPPMPSTVRILSTKTKSASVEWDAPFNMGSPILEYQLLYSNGKSIFTNHTKQTHFKLNHLKPHTTYVIKVRARSEIGYSLYSRQTAFRTKPGHSSSPPIYYNDDDALPNGDATHTSTHASAVDPWPNTNRNRVVVVLAVSGSLLIITVSALIFICGWKKRSPKKNIDDMEKYPGFINNSVDLVSIRTYIDPSTYEDPYTAVEQFAKEIDHKMVNVHCVIGRGEFGEVCKGVLEPDEISVAIKTLKSGYSNQEKLDFLSEASIMGQFDHPNVIHLEGVVTQSRPLMIITEYMENGSLDVYLKKNAGAFLTKQLTQILLSIASGMKYLNGIGYVHRDLAARNILINSQLVCKVSDFGLSRYLEEANDEERVAMYTTRGGMIPIRWTAPEAISKRTFSTCSDVWSYGIVMWEVLSYGERPYWEMSNPDVVSFVERGYRLPPPCFCPRVLHKLMLECWNYDLTSRPSFTDLVSVLNHFLQEPSCLQETINRRSLDSQNDCIPEMLDLSALSQWLEEMDMLHYKPYLLRYGCVTAEQIMRLTAEELQEMGVVNFNDVNSLLQEAQILQYKIGQARNNSVVV